MTDLPKRELGRTGLRVSMLGYGAMELRGAPQVRPTTDLDTTIVGTANPAHLHDNVAILQKGPLPAELRRSHTTCFRGRLRASGRVIASRS
jgi:aryl-alcohol dehydrogenase-like predicted oxidoreductase